MSKPMVKVIGGLIFVTLGIFLAYLSAAMGDPKMLSRGLYLHVHPDWGIMALAVFFFLLGVTIVFIPIPPRRERSRDQDLPL